MAHLGEVAAFPNVLVQACRPWPTRHPERFMVTDGAGYAEHVLGGFVYTEPETVTALSACSIRYGRSATAPPRVRRLSGRQVLYGLAKEQLQRSQRRSGVEVADDARAVLVRDTTDRDGQTLATAEAWQAPGYAPLTPRGDWEPPVTVTAAP